MISHCNKHQTSSRAELADRRFFNQASDKTIENHNNSHLQASIYSSIIFSKLAIIMVKAIFLMSDYGHDPTGEKRLLTLSQMSIVSQTSINR